jgi:beta-glucosidase
MILALKGRGITPFVTLWHWTLPVWLRDEGGLLSENFAFYFTRYCEKAMAHLGSELHFVVTLNEPDVVASHAYLKGAWPPQQKSIFGFLKATFHLLQAHQASYAAMKKTHPALEIGIAKHQVYFETASPTFWNTLLKRLADYVWNRWWLNRIRHFQDFIGLNHYNRNVINGWYGKNPNQIQTDFGWEFCPESLEFAIRELIRYGKPIYITENGLADASDTLRRQFIPRALSALQRSLQAGADVRGYMYWSLLDNFEWDKGFWPRFGLIAIDRTTQERQVRTSALEYAAYIRENSLR